MGDREPSVETLLDAFVGPFVRLISDQQDRSLVRLVGRILTDAPPPALRRGVLEQADETDTMYLEALGRALPHLSHDELAWRFYATLGTVIFQLVGAAAMEVSGKARPFGAPSQDAEKLRVRTVAFLAAGLRAPTTEPLG